MNPIVYESGPFGDLLRGDFKSYPIHLFTKYCDQETGLLYYGYRYFNPAPGRWISNDPISDKSFFLQATQGKTQLAKGELAKQANQPSSLFVHNDPQNRYDQLGLDDASVTWNPPLKTCPKGQLVVYIQVAYGGFYNPVVDNGSRGFGAKGTGCPEYPNFGRPGSFEDSPGGLGTATTYITALACAQTCCGPNKPGESYRRIVSILYLVTWHLGDQGSPRLSPNSPPFLPSTFAETATFYTTLNREYPNFTSCYTCKQP